MIKQIKQAASQAASRIGGMVYTGHGANGAAGHGGSGAYDASAKNSLAELQSRLDHIRSGMRDMRQELKAYSNQVLAAACSANSLSQSWAQLYSQSASRSTSLQIFQANQAKIDQTAMGLYKDVFDTEVLKVFDDWEQDSLRISKDIDKTESARQRVASLEATVLSLQKTSRERSLTAQESSSLEQNSTTLENYKGMFTTMRSNLDKNFNSFCEQRFSVLDRAFVRFMELQIDFSRESSSASSNFQNIIHNYRKRFPLSRGSSLNSSTLSQPSSSSSNSSASNSPIAPMSVVGSLPNQSSGMSNDILGLHSSPSLSASPPPSAGGRHTQHQASFSLPLHSPPLLNNGLSPHPSSSFSMKNSPLGNKNISESDESTDSSDSDSDSATDSEDESPKKVQPAPAIRAKIETKAPTPQPSNVLNLLDFASMSSVPSAPVSAAPSRSSSNADTLLDIFGSAPPSQPKETIKDSSFLHPNASITHSASDFSLLDFASTPHKPAASSKANGGGGFDLNSFDPLSRNTPLKVSKSTSNISSIPIVNAGFQPTSTEAHVVIRSNTPPPQEASTVSSIAYIPPTEMLDQHIQEQQESQVEKMREHQEKAENDLEQRHAAERDLDGMLTAWECSKDGQRKNIRNLLSSVHTILWANSGWKPVSVADLIDFNGIKKAHMKVIRVVHPDKLTDPTPQQAAIALRVFDVLNQAFDQFKETGQ